MDLTYVVVLMLSGVAVFVLCIGLYESWQSYGHSRHRILAQRVNAMLLTEVKPASLKIVHDLRLSQYPFVDSWLRQVPGMLRFDLFLRQAHVRWDLSQVLFLMLCWLVFAALVVLLWGGPASLILVLGVAMPSLWVAYLLRFKQRHVEQVDAQLPDALDLICLLYTSDAADE